MRLLRTVISLAMIAIGAVVFTEMLRYPIKYSLTGLVLGAAMAALGVVRLRALYATDRRK